MGLLCARFLLLLLFLCLILYYVGINAATLSKPSMKARTVKREQLGNMMRNILSKHDSNARLHNLRATLANVRPAAAISCDDNDIGIEFDLNDQIVISNDVALQHHDQQQHQNQHIYNAFPERADQLIMDAGDVYCDEVKPSKNSSRLRWKSAPNALTHIEYEQIAAPPSSVSVHQYGTNYFQHNTYAMPTIPTHIKDGNGEINESTTTKATTTRSNYYIQGYDKHNSTEERQDGEEEDYEDKKDVEAVVNAGVEAKAEEERARAELSTPTNELTTSTTEMEGITKVTTTKPSSKDLSVENIFIIHRNRKKKDRVPTTSANTKGYKAPINIQVNGNGKLANVTSMQPKLTHNKQYTKKPRRKEQMPTQNLSSADIQNVPAPVTSSASPNSTLNVDKADKSNKNAPQLTNSSEIRLPTNEMPETNVETTKPSVKDNAFINAMGEAQGENRTERSSNQLDAGKRSTTDSSAIESVEDKYEYEDKDKVESEGEGEGEGGDGDEDEVRISSSTENAVRQLTTVMPESKVISKPKGRKFFTQSRKSMRKSNDGKPAGTNYYYYYTKPELNRNHHLTRLRKPTVKPQLEPIAYEALDGEFIAKHDAPPKRNYIMEHHRKINDLKYSSSIAKRGGKLAQKQSPSHSEEEKCLQHVDSGDYIPTKPRRNKRVKDIIATERKYWQDGDTHYFRELRPFEEPIGGRDCPEDNKVAEKFNDRFVDSNRKPQISETSEATNENISDYFMCGESAEGSTKSATKK